MTCHLDQCTLHFRAWCPACRWSGPFRDATVEAVEDCREHNRKLRHRALEHRYARVLVEHQHQHTAEGVSA